MLIKLLITYEVDFSISNAGETFIAQQNLMGTFQLYKGFYDPASTLLNVSSPKQGVGNPLLSFERDYGLIGSIMRC